MEEQQDEIKTGKPLDKGNVLAADEATVVLKRVDGGLIVPGAPIPPDADLPEIPDCRLLSILGSGGMGVVYLGKQLTLDRYVAVKMLNSQYVKSPEFVERMRREARIMGALDHPNVVGCHDIICRDDSIFIVMEYIPGRFTARDLVIRFGPIPEKYVVTMMCQVVSGLAFVYGKGFIHRDLKPDNLLFYRETMGTPRTLAEIFEESEPRILLCDFGLAVPQKEVADQKEQLMGSLAFMSPEQLANQGDIDFRSDMYSLAATAYYLLSGTLPFGNIRDRNIRIETKMFQDLPISNLRRPGQTHISHDLARILSCLGAVDPSRRYKDYGRLLRELRELEQYQKTGVHHMASMLGRHFLHWLGASFIVLLVIACALFYLIVQVKYRQSWRSNPDLSASLVHWDFHRGGWRLQAVDDSNEMIMVGGSGGARLHKRLKIGRLLSGKFRLPRSEEVAMAFYDQDNSRRVILEISRKDDDTVIMTMSADGRTITLAPEYKCGRWRWLNLAWEIDEDRLYFRCNGKPEAVCVLDQSWDCAYYQIDSIEGGSLEIKDLINVNPGQLEK